MWTVDRDGMEFVVDGKVNGEATCDDSAGSRRTPVGET